MNINATFFAELLAFCIFVFITYRYIWPSMENLLEDRRKEISDGLEAASQSQRKGIVIVISEFFDDEDSTLEAVQHLRFVGHEVIGLQILDHDEITFPFNGLVEFEGLEEIPNLKTRPTEIRKSYLNEFNEFQEKLRAVSYTHLTLPTSDLV